MEGKHEREHSEDVANGHTNGHTNGTKRGGIGQTLYPGTGVGNRYKNHCRRFWWCDLLVIAVITLVIVLPVIFVAIPKKAQHDLDASTLEVTQQDVTNPTPDQVHLKLVTVAKSSSSFHPTIEGFRASLSIPGQPAFLELDIPETKAEAETTITVDKDVKFVSKDQFIAYNKLVISSEEFEVAMNGKTKIHQSGLSAIDVNYDKTIKMKGLNGLKGLNITDAALDSKLPQPYNLKGNAVIPNPSVMTIQLGNVTMDLAVDGTNIGQSLIQDLTLKPGTNNLAMIANVDQGAVLKLVTSKYKNGVLPIDVTGNSSTVGTQHLEYYEAAIRSNKLRLDLNVGPILSSLGLNITSG